MDTKRVRAAARPVFRNTRSFWRRLTEGLALSELWDQFLSEAKAGYSVYTADVDWSPSKEQSRWKRFLKISQALFWAMILKLSPARRVLLLVSLLLVVGERASPDSNRPPLGALGLLILLAMELADRVAMKRDLEIAREIQNWLVPDAPPSADSVDIAFMTQPANTVSGDYYDAFFRPPNSAESPSQKLLLVVADVAGKGIPAALLMGTFQATLRTLAEEPLALPGLVDRLNARACDSSSGGRRFTTAFVAELDTSTGALSYVNAGHNPPLLRRASGELTRLEPGGLPLGIRAESSYEFGAATLQEGDLLLVYTDGVVEAEDARGQEYGDRRLAAWLQAAPAASAAEHLERLMSSIAAFVGPTRQHDDITCVVLRVPAGP